MKDLGTLGGLNSIAFGVNAYGETVGEAESSSSDPNGEDFCGFGTHLICLPTLWQGGKPNALPTLGGNNGVVNRNNNWGFAVGWAETSKDDLACPAPQKASFQSCRLGGRLPDRASHQKRRPGRNCSGNQRLRRHRGIVWNLFHLQSEPVVQSPRRACLIVAERQGR